MDDITARDLDAACLLMLWRTSSPEARRRDRREARIGSPVYDTDSEDPRAYVCLCAFCGVRVLMLPSSRPYQRFCSESCRAKASYWRHRVAISERTKAIRRRDPEAVRAKEKAYRDANRDRIRGLHRASRTRLRARAEAAA